MEERTALTLRRVILLVAVILFALALFKVDAGGWSLVDAGLALFALAFLV